MASTRWRVHLTASVMLSSESMFMTVTQHDVSTFMVWICLPLMLFKCHRPPTYLGGLCVPHILFLVWYHCHKMVQSEPTLPVSPPSVFGVGRAVIKAFCVQMEPTRVTSLVPLCSRALGAVSRWLFVVFAPTESCQQTRKPSTVQ